MDVLPITVAVSTYNRAGLLELCLKSILNSTRQPAEVLVMDDGSADNTRETVAAFGDKVKYFYQKRMIKNCDTRTTAIRAMG